jgi:hypothetical protein
VAWDEELDADRLRQAFRGLTRWPAPRELMDALPSRPQRRALPKPEMSDEERARNRARLAEMMAALGMRMDDKKESKPRGD